ncbi:MAG TPA: 2-dehydropantoate 2-reductase, partial [Chthoniobacterales bacterium]
AVLVAVKTWQVNEAAAAILPLLGRNSIVVPLQNGVDAPAQLGAAVGADHVVGGLCKIIAQVTRPGVIHHIAADPFIAFGEIEPAGKNDRLENLRSAFVRAGVDCEIATDIVAAIWEKFLFITPWGSLGAFTRLPAGAIRSDPQLRTRLMKAMQEIVEIARRRRVNLPADAADKTMRVIDGLPPDSTSSMQRDIMAGRPSELEGQTGAVVRLGRAAGVPAPIHQAIYAALLPLERKARGA